MSVLEREVGDKSHNKKNHHSNAIIIKVVENKVLFPGLVAQVVLEKNYQTLKFLKNIRTAKTQIGIIQRINNSSGELTMAKTGTIAQVIDILQRSDDHIHVLLKGVDKFQIKQIITGDPLDGDDLLVADVATLDESYTKKLTKKHNVLINSLKESTIELIKNDPDVAKDIEELIASIDDPTFLAYFTFSGSSADSSEKQNFLDESDIIKKLKIAYKHILKDLDIFKIKRDIKSKLKSDITEQQREYLLRQEMKAIQHELGEEEETEVSILRAKGEKKDWPDKVQKHFQNSLKKADRIPIQSPEYATYINHSEYLLDLPWSITTKDNFDLTKAKTVLDSHHFGIEKIKERIIEHLAVMRLKGDKKGSILCLHGPPGVGKTSLCKSIAKALGRNYQRISLASLSDEAEIKGHRKTYIGSMPGKIIQAIKNANSANPLIVLDEIDKIDDTKRHNTSSALLELLDPEQNDAFVDNFIEVPFDMSKVMFIATANDIWEIPHPLRDRMELIEITGYTIEEKVQIAKKYIISQEKKEHGLGKGSFSISDRGLKSLIDKYTSESGVRELKRQIAQICRKVAKFLAIDQDYPKKIEELHLAKFLGIEKYEKEEYHSHSLPGIATGLAYTTVGGEIMSIETAATKGKGNLTISGQLGDVMKESAMAAHSYLKSQADTLEIDKMIFDQYDLHIHVPDGATPKDGPSAGITLLSALTSLYTQRKVAEKITMSGEITLSGRVLPVGGIKEKILAAKRAGINKIILSQKNEKDILEIKDIYKKNLKFFFVQSADEVLDLALCKTKVKNPIQWEIEEDKND